jgi:hypothetical protein
MLIDRGPDLIELVASGFDEAEIAGTGSVALTEDAIELADLTGIVGVPLRRVMLGQRPRCTNSASFLSSASYGSSVAGAPSGGAPGFRPRLAHVPRNACRHPCLRMCR